MEVKRQNWPDRQKKRLDIAMKRIDYKTSLLNKYLNNKSLTKREETILQPHLQRIGKECLEAIRQSQTNKK
ncbi:MAG: hypothetical protein CL946_01020 [Ectothiorhodospiraceae bacterium]|nr:hypothetical protein [Ectothiorhodospiraceae bacterium]